MKKQRYLAVLVCVMMLIVFTASASAPNSSFSFHGSCVRFFNTSSSITRPEDPDVNWSCFTIRPDTLSYAGSTRATAHALPITPSGAGCGSVKTVSRNQNTFYTPNAVGDNATVVKARLINSYYQETGDTSPYSLTIGGQMFGA